jgi:hypothetical protein
MTAAHRRPRSLAVLALTLLAVFASALVPEPALARPKAKTKGKAKATSARKPPAAAAPLSVAPMKFKVSTPNYTQHLEIIPQAPGSVAFTLMISGGCQRAVSGLASAAVGEALTGQDEFGVSYPVNEYRHQGKDGCFLSLRIDARQGKRATVGQADCEVACTPIEDLMFRTAKFAPHH